MTDDRILDIAHRTATRYAHTAVDPATAFAFNKTHMIDFGRKILAEAAQPEPKPDYRAMVAEMDMNDVVLQAIDDDSIDQEPARSEPVSPQIVWPKARDVGRYGDMSPSAHLRVGFDSDNDVCVSVWDDNGGASIEFCNGGGGGGRSPRTRLALIALMVAMEAENAATPALDWWAVRSGAAAKAGV